VSSAKCKGFPSSCFLCTFKAPHPEPHPFKTRQRMLHLFRIKKKGRRAKSKVPARLIRTSGGCGWNEYHVVNSFRLWQLICPTLLFFIVVHKKSVTFLGVLGLKERLLRQFVFDKVAKRRRYGAGGTGCKFEIILNAQIKSRVRYF